MQAKNDRAYAQAKKLFDARTGRVGNKRPTFNEASSSQDIYNAGNRLAQGLLRSIGKLSNMKIDKHFSAETKQAFSNRYNSIVITFSDTNNNAPFIDTADSLIALYNDLKIIQALKKKDALINVVNSIIERYEQMGLACPLDAEAFKALKADSTNNSQVEKDIATLKDMLAKAFPKDNENTVQAIFSSFFSMISEKSAAERSTKVHSMMKQRCLASCEQAVQDYLNNKLSLSTLNTMINQQFNYLNDRIQFTYQSYLSAKNDLATASPLDPLLESHLSQFNRGFQVKEDAFATLTGSFDEVSLQYEKTYALERDRLWLFSDIQKSLNHLNELQATYPRAKEAIGVYRELMLTDLEAALNTSLNEANLNTALEKYQDYQKFIEQWPKQLARIEAFEKQVQQLNGKLTKLGNQFVHQTPIEVQNMKALIDKSFFGSTIEPLGKALQQAPSFNTDTGFTSSIAPEDRAYYVAAHKTHFNKLRLLDKLQKNMQALRSIETYQKDAVATFERQMITDCQVILYRGTANKEDFKLAFEQLDKVWKKINEWKKMDEAFGVINSKKSRFDKLNAKAHPLVQQFLRDIGNQISKIETHFKAQEDNFNQERPVDFDDVLTAFGESYEAHKEDLYLLNKLQEKIDQFDRLIEENTSFETQITVYKEQMLNELRQHQSITDNNREFFSTISRKYTRIAGMLDERMKYLNLRLQQTTTWREETKGILANPMKFDNERFTSSESLQKFCQLLEYMNDPRIKTEPTSLDDFIRFADNNKMDRILYLKAEIEALKDNMNPEEAKAADLFLVNHAIPSICETNFDNLDSIKIQESKLRIAASTHFQLNWFLKAVESVVRAVFNPQFTIKSVTKTQVETHLENAFSSKFKQQLAAVKLKQPHPEMDQHDDLESENKPKPR